MKRWLIRIGFGIVVVGCLVGWEVHRHYQKLIEDHIEAYPTGDLAQLRAVREQSPRIEAFRDVDVSSLGVEKEYKFVAPVTQWDRDLDPRVQVQAIKDWVDESTEDGCLSQHLSAEDGWTKPILDCSQQPCILTANRRGEATIDRGMQTMFNCVYLYHTICGPGLRQQPDWASINSCFRNYNDGDKLEETPTELVAFQQTHPNIGGHDTIQMSIVFPIIYAPPWYEQ